MLRLWVFVALQNDDGTLFLRWAFDDPAVATESVRLEQVRKLEQVQRSKRDRCDDAKSIWASTVGSYRGH